ncbi:clustered mitochondria protein [Aphis craccivora]|uniref:Clustered mitochondria protein homolog n=1 Tax=Aphis craccivora TaxID=307492 RepID=A0A6G0YGH3_APHCR|nr:clustered mitochondria protein [Aphis craccivora]
MFVNLTQNLHGNIEIVCNDHKTPSVDHLVNGISGQEVNSESTTTVNHVDVVNNNESHTKKQLKKSSKKDKDVEKTVTDPNINISHSDDSSEESTDNDKKQGTEIIFIQDLGFNVKIVCPGTEAFEIQVSSMELVQEIHQLLMDREDTCHRTCFSLQLNGVTLDNFSELKTIDGLKEGSIIKVVEEPYTMREARIHVRHVRDILKSLEMADAYNGVDCNSLSFLNVVTQEKKKTRSESVDCTPPDYIMPNNKDRPLLPLHPTSKDLKGPLCIKVLTTSAWNPPPGFRKMHGDLMYMYVITLEDKHFHITACTKGFFINQSTNEEFNPKPAAPNHLCHSLIELLSQVSPAFKRNFAALQKKRTARHPFERVATPYQVYSWASPLLEHTLDAIRAEDTFSSKLGYEEHIPGQTRDWNEELQTTRELPRKNLPERLLRERAIFKVHGDFVAAATRGAMAVIDGNVMAINPGEEAKMQMFIWNNIFFSLGFDVRDHYKELGGDAAAFVAPRNDLQGVRVYSAVDLPGLYTLGTVVVDYRGYRVTAQSIIPGILEREQEQSVVYGSVDFGKTVTTNPKYIELLSQAAQQLKIMPHKVISEKSEEIELCSSVECKGIIGNDSRYYILDLLRTFPPDVNFLLLDEDILSKEVKSLGFPIQHRHKLCCLRQELIDSFIETRYMMFIKYAAFHLQHLNLWKNQKNVDSVVDNNELIKEKRTHNIDENGKNEITDIKKNDNKGDETTLEESLETKKKIVETITESAVKDSDDNSTKEVVKKAAQKVGSLKETEFDIRFNPDVFSPGVKHFNPESDQFKLEKQLVVDAAEYLLLSQIPLFVSYTLFTMRSLLGDDQFLSGSGQTLSPHLVKEFQSGMLKLQNKTIPMRTTRPPSNDLIVNGIRDCMDHSSAPMDGQILSENLHTRGINIRYLGKIAEKLSKIKQLEYLYSITVAELITRAAKHIFNTYIQSAELMSLANAVSHFLNCFLSSCSTPHPQNTLDDVKPIKKRNKRKGRLNRLLTVDNKDWANLTRHALWSQIRAEIKSYYAWELVSETIESICEHYGTQKISLLRSFCLKTGIQILLREYSFDSKNRFTFFEEDIVNMFPVVKHINPRATDAFNFYTTGQTKIQQGLLKEGYDLIMEALTLLNNVYGAMHPEIAQCLRMLARLSYIMGDYGEAMAYQQKAVFMSERVNGIDHPYTITEYIHLALYCYANNQITTALKLLYRARYLAVLICGENHPEIALLDSNISLILHAVQEYDLSLRFLEKALALNIKFYGPKSLKVAVSYHLVARTQSCMGDFRSALSNERETYAIYKQQFGEKHEKTQESSDCLKHLTHQAVVLQKKMNEIYTGKTGATLPPIQIHPPSMGSVLDMLNVINGILYVQISQQDLENFKAEVEKRSETLDLVKPSTEQECTS